jgi:hypothetical protein
MKVRSDVTESLDHFVKENQWILRRTIITNGAMEEKGRNWRANNHMKWGITQQFTEPYSPWLLINSD